MVVYMNAALENLQYTRVNLRVALLRQGENTYFPSDGYKILHGWVQHSYMYIVVKNCAQIFSHAHFVDTMPIMLNYFVLS